MDNNKKQELLEQLAREISSNATLPLVDSANLVFGEGNPNTEILFIGEAPGQNEDEQKRPFVGRAGQLLRKMIRDAGWKEEEVYITNIVKRRPPENRDPLPEEIAAYKPYLSKQIEIINPEVIVPLGRFAMNYFLPDAKISRDQGKLFFAGKRAIIPVFHPAAALRAPQMMKEFVMSFHLLPKLIEEAKQTPRDVFFSEDDEDILPKTIEMEFAQPENKTISEIKTEQEKLF